MSVRNGKVLLAKERSGGPFNLYYQVRGSEDSSKKALLIMGLFGSNYAWEIQSKFLASKGYEVCTYDNRGVGHSDAPSGLYTTKEMALDAVELLNHLGWNSNVTVIGISMGGMIAQELALAAKPGTISCLILTSTHAGMTFTPIAGLLGVMKGLLAKNSDQLIENNCQMLYPQTWLAAAAPENSGFKTNKDVIVKRLTDAAGVVPPPKTAGIYGQLSAVMRHYVSKDRLHKIRDFGYPILVVTGTEDNLIRPTNSHYLAKELNARLEVFENSGHAIPAEQEDRYNSLILEVMEGASK
ncbi:alpha/beta-hydrolase [Basidiobolus meristosporus CBS 931.73]|uniref:Alpha/beta-hydrolase n=1 Tax=Basidiobolus meristosporus CBS 931.73 TaxID=1314790 RepID=A0A1Y1Z6S1_9FUNG|nr:alpha/beta-hydrolase [Basidiobolus meristosporus CBS 931.73]|eukprot:ORY05978.1 alpha/beta-hydrolase [Basidiobolus meristosporus CBS 931.73]